MSADAIYLAFRPRPQRLEPVPLEWPLCWAIAVLLPFLALPAIEPLQQPDQCHAAIADATYHDELADSAICLGCHDGAIAPELGKTHPLGVDYTAAHYRKPAKLRHPSELPSWLRLPSGKVECITCHTVDNRPICTTCHPM